MAKLDIHELPAARGCTYLLPGPATMKEFQWFSGLGEKVAKMTFGERPSTALVDLPAHAILDRGRLIGYWELDVDAEQIVWVTFVGK